MNIGARIEERLKHLEMSQSELARRTSLNQSTINGLIRGQSRSSTHLHRIARELHTTPAYLTGETDDPESGTPAEPDLSAEEAKLVTIWRQLPPEHRQALNRLLEVMLGPRTVHSPRLIYRAAEG